ncbi:uncharacterized protein VTP21DRAFT_10695 [Calcarisporiella thermophila]|uniref:uncharacterized protein n=1 Tax=Calcarisporiella thermophila TaxID=911321 RepID=UPI003743A446
MAETQAKNCNQNVQSEGIAFLTANGYSSWKDAINFWYVTGLRDYNFTDPKPLTRGLMFMNIVTPKNQKVGCSASYCAGTFYKLCLFEWVGPIPSSVNEYLDEFKTNVRPLNPNSTLTSNDKERLIVPATSNVIKSNATQYASIMAAVLISLSAAFLL